MTTDKRGKWSELKGRWCEWCGNSGFVETYAQEAPAVHFAYRCGYCPAAEVRGLAETWPVYKPELGIGGVKVRKHTEASDGEYWADVRAFWERNGITFKRPGQAEVSDKADREKDPVDGPDPEEIPVPF